MTSILSLPSASPSAAEGPAAVRTRRAPVAGVLAALLAAGAGLLVTVLPVLGVWAAEARSGAGAVEAVRAAGQVWLVAHGASLEVPGGRLALTPLGMLALPLWLLWRAGAWVAREVRAGSVRAVAGAVAAVAVPYAALAAAVALLSRTADVRPSVPSAALAGLAVGLVGAGAGALGRQRLWRAAWLRLGVRSRRTAPAVAAATAALAGGGSLLAGASLAVHAGSAAELAGATAPGPVGGAALLLLGVALVPNAVLWAAAWLTGPGFAVGVGTAVGPFGHLLGPVPALPLLAALPGSPVPSRAGVLVLLVPLAAGALAGCVLWRRADGVLATRRAVADTVLTAAACGVLWGGLAALSAGAAGGERLTELGPSARAVGAAVAVEVGVGAAAALLVLRRRGRAAAAGPVRP